VYSHTLPASNAEKRGCYATTPPRAFKTNPDEPVGADIAITLCRTMVLLLNSSDYVKKLSEPIDTFRCLMYFYLFICSFTCLAATHIPYRIS